MTGTHSPAARGPPSLPSAQPPSPTIPLPNNFKKWAERGNVRFFNCTNRGISLLHKPSNYPLLKLAAIGTNSMNATEGISFRNGEHLLGLVHPEVSMSPRMVNINSTEELQESAITSRTEHQKTTKPTEYQGTLNHSKIHHYLRHHLHDRQIRVVLDNDEMFMELELSELIDYVGILFQIEKNGGLVKLNVYGASEDGGCHCLPRFFGCHGNISWYSEPIASSVLTSPETVAVGDRMDEDEGSFSETSSPPASPNNIGGEELLYVKLAR